MIVVVLLVGCEGGTSELEDRFRIVLQADMRQIGVAAEMMFQEDPELDELMVSDITFLQPFLILDPDDIEQPIRRADVGDAWQPHVVHKHFGSIKDIKHANGTLLASGGASIQQTVYATEEFVRANLRAPSTAEFAPRKELTMTVSGDRYTVWGWVDAQNSFGAQLRNPYQVSMRYDVNLGRFVDKSIVMGE